MLELYWLPKLVNKLVTKKYQWNAIDYSVNSSNQKRWAFENIWKLNLNGNERILDIGCGDGKITAELSKIIPNGFVIGIDNSEDMIELAKSSYETGKFPNLQFHLMDASRLDFNSIFDIVFSSSALHWILEHNPVLQGIFNSLRPGGKVFLQMGGKGNAKEFIDNINWVINRDWHNYFINFKFPWAFYSPDEYMNLLVDAGFKIVRLELVPKIMVHKNADSLKGWIRTTWHPYIERIPVQMREKFMNDVVDSYLDKGFIDNESNIIVNMVRLEVEAIKP